MVGLRNFQNEFVFGKTIDIPPNRMNADKMNTFTAEQIASFKAQHESMKREREALEQVWNLLKDLDGKVYQAFSGK